MILGINADDVLEQKDHILASVSPMKTRPVLGVVCDPGIPASVYRPVAELLAPTMDLLWRPFDSASLVDEKGRPRYTTDSYQHRAEDYAATLGRFCGKNGGIECGNEITLPEEFVGRAIGLQTQMAVQVCNAHQLNSYVCYFFDADDVHYMVFCASRWNIRSTYATLSIYPNTYLTRDWSLDDAVQRLDYAVPGVTKLVGEFGTQDSKGKDRAGAAAHLTWVKQILSFRPTRETIRYALGGFEWDFLKYITQPAQRKFYQELVIE